MTDPAVLMTAKGTSSCALSPNDKDKYADVESNELNDDSQTTKVTQSVVIHPLNESELFTIPCICSEYATCNLFIHGFMRQIMSTIHEGWKQDDVELTALTELRLKCLVRIIEHYSFESLVVGSGVTEQLYPSSEFVYNYVVIEEGAILTSRNQGVILIQCFDLLIRQKGTLHLNGKGYYGDLPENQGGSYKGLFVDCTCVSMLSAI